MMGCCTRRLTENGIHMQIIEFGTCLKLLTSGSLARHYRMVTGNQKKIARRRRLETNTEAVRDFIELFLGKVNA
jgi:hypothetical protein